MFSCVCEETWTKEVRQRNQCYGVLYST